VALQFQYEEADCRLYYTPEMTVDITALWKSAADAQWKNSGKCIGSSSYGGDGKRAAIPKISKVTTKLSSPVARVKVAKVETMRRVKAFEKTFDLETKCGLKGDGFMEP
jgi:hypothetical protein